MKKKLLHSAIFSLCILTAFSLGYLTANLVKLQKPAVVVDKLTDNTYSTGNNGFLQEYEGEVVASVNSTKFHYEHCPGAKRIKEENKIYFPSAEEAIEAGFELAGNCR